MTDETSASVRNPSPSGARGAASRVWRLLPRGFRSGLANTYDRAYLLGHRLNDLRYELALNISTGLDRPFGDAEAQATECGDPVKTQSTPYSYLRLLRDYMKFNADDTFVDVGCGTGRVVIYMADSALGQSRGIDFDQTAYEAACRNLERARVPKDGIRFMQGDATRVSFDDASVVYFGNPFGEKTMARVLDNIRKSLERKPRQLRICYYAPVCRALLDDAPWLTQIHTIKTVKKPVLVYRNDPLLKTQGLEPPAE